MAEIGGRASTRRRETVRRGRFMQQYSTEVWRSLLQLGQAAHTVLEREVPESQGVPTNGLAVLRLLRWHGGKTSTAIAAFVGVTPAAMDVTMREMMRQHFVKRQSTMSNSQSVVFEIAPPGLDVARRIIAIQRDRIDRSLTRLSAEQYELAAQLLETLARDLVVDSVEFAIACAECWAFDARECVTAGREDYCAFRKAHRAVLDPDLSEGPEECAGSCSAAGFRCRTQGTHYRGTA